MRSPSDAREWLRSHNITITEWSRARGFPRGLVYALLSGRVKGSLGKSRAAAVALGIAVPPYGPSPLDEPTGAARKMEEREVAAETT